MLTSDGTVADRLSCSTPSSTRPGRPSRAPCWTEAVGQLERVLRRRAHRVRPAARAGRHAVPASTWLALREIPYAETINYGQLALRVGNPKAPARSALANGRNPISIVVPCHRVIGADGSLTGYGGGLDRKRLLLDLERRVAGAEDPQLTLL